MFMAQNIIIIKGGKYPRSVTQLYQRLLNSTMILRSLFNSYNFSDQYSEKLDKSSGEELLTLIAKFLLAPINPL